MELEKEEKKQIQILFVLIDGLADLGIKQYSEQTPLQYANVPTFDLIAASGVSGIMDPVETGLACGSDTAHMNIFGYNPFEFYKGRGSYETMGAGLNMEGNEIAFKCNFAYMDPETQIVHKRRVDREFDKWGKPLIDYIDGLKIPGFDGYYIRAKWATEHRLGIKISGGNKLSQKITGTDPLKDNLKLRKVFPINPEDETAIYTANMVNTLSEELIKQLKNHPINIEREKQKKLPANLILLRGCGQKLNVQPFNQKYNLKGFMVAPTAIIKGLGQTIGLHTPHVEGATGDYNSDYIKKAEKAIQLFNQEDYNFGFVHIKAVDDAGHDKSLEKKTEYIKKVDEMIKFIYEKMNQEFEKQNNKNRDLIICLTGDHTTPVLQGDHTFEPVPLTISTINQMKKYFNHINNTKQHEIINIFQDNVIQFDEISCGSGVLGRFPGSEVMQTITKLKKLLEQ